MCIQKKAELVVYETYLHFVPVFYRSVYILEYEMFNGNL